MIRAAGIPATACADLRALDNTREDATHKIPRRISPPRDRISIVNCEPYMRLHQLSISAFALSLA
jgi:hypothetical protein